MLDRGQRQRSTVREAAVWLEELAPEARARKALLLAAWVHSAEALRSAIRAQESERGPLAEALFPDWRGPSLRRHSDQALAAEAELQRRLSSAYVARRLAEAGTETPLRPAIDGLAAARSAWAVDRDRTALAGVEAEEVRSRLLAVAGETAQMLERVRWIVRAALVHRPDLAEQVFPRRVRPAEPTAQDPASVPQPAHAEGTNTPPENAPPDAHPTPTARRGSAVRVRPPRLPGPEAAPSPPEPGPRRPPTPRKRRPDGSEPGGPSDAPEANEQSRRERSGRSARRTGKARPARRS
jgi:hypothetical protein